MPKFQIKLEKPCVQPWDTMERVGNGLYCEQCTKVVTDFSSMTDEELIDALSQKRKEPICGRFTGLQLSKSYAVKPAEEKQSFIFWKVALAGLLTLELPVYSQLPGAAPKTKQVQTTPIKLIPKTSLTPQIIRGKVSDRTSKKGLAVKISLYAKHTKGEVLFDTYSDASGYYEIELPAEGLAKFFKLVYVCEDFDERSIVVDKEKVPKQLNVTLMPQPVITVTTTNLPEVEVAVKHSAVSVEYSPRHFGGIPVQYETYSIDSYRSRFFYRVKWRLKNFFKRKRSH
ncbi:MAG: hypothetical protein IT236_03200 [Bacteroidia bacterium]|nr:hypothetical protein [Bacteroidia bacterium]